MLQGNILFCLVIVGSIFIKGDHQKVLQDHAGSRGLLRLLLLLFQLADDFFCAIGGVCYFAVGVYY